jgi:hypothetical protein
LLHVTLTVVFLFLPLLLLLLLFSFLSISLSLSLSPCLSGLNAFAVFGIIISVMLVGAFLVAGAWWYFQRRNRPDASAMSSHSNSQPMMSAQQQQGDYVRHTDDFADSGYADQRASAFGGESYTSPQVVSTPAEAAVTGASSAAGGAGGAVGTSGTFGGGESAFAERAHQGLPAVADVSDEPEVAYDEVESAHAVSFTDQPTHESTPLSPEVSDL